MTPYAKLTVELAGQHVIVHIAVVNPPSGAALYLEKSKIVATPPVRAKLFQITTDGNEVPYIGALAKRKAPTADDFFVVAPGSQIEGFADITDLYAFLPGEHRYSIRYRAFHGDPHDAAKLVEIVSEPATFEFSR